MSLQPIEHQLSLLRDNQHVVSVVVANHDLNVTLRRADNVVLLSNGVLEAVGSSQHVLTVENINSVYRTNVQKVEHNGRAYLIFED